MKKLIVWITMAACLGACGMRQDTSRKIDRGRDGNQASPNRTFLKTNENLVLKWGEVIANPADPYLTNDTDGSIQASFMDAVSGLMEATLPVEAIGWVSGSSGLDPSVYGINTGQQFQPPSTGVRFIGRIALTPDGKQVDKLKTALRIVIYDEFTGQTIDGKVIPEYPIFFDKAVDSYFDAATKNVYLAFQDEFGMVYMEGSYNANYFVGVMAYDNFKTAVEGGTPAAGTLGTFQIPTCGILLEVAECQQQ